MAKTGNLTAEEIEERAKRHAEFRRLLEQRLETDRRIAAECETGKKRP